MAKSFYQRGKNIAKKIVKRTAKYAKKRYAPKGVLNVRNIVKDVNYLKKQMNVEKKHHNNEFLTNFAQFGTAATPTSGHNLFEITPAPAQGQTATTRNGNSIKITGCMVNIQLTPMSATTLQTRFKIYMYCVNQSPLTTSPAVSAVLDRTIFDGTASNPVYDFTSLRNQENVGNIKIVKVFTGVIRSDTDIGLSYKRTIQQPLKFNHHLRYDTDASTVSTKNRMYLLCVADQGEVNANTGISIEGQIKWWYVDN